MLKSRFLFFIAVLLGPLVYCQNILISNARNPNEPSIMLDYKHPGIMVAGANLNNYYLSTDTGRTWTEQTLSSTYGVWGDPVIDVDTSGRFYFFHLSNPSSGNWIDRIVCQTSDNAGLTWTPGTYTGLNGTKAQDKQWSAVDRQNNYIYLTWTQFDDYGSSQPADSSVILFSRSMDGGATWSNAKRINKRAGNCIDEDDTVEGAVPAIGPNGEIYVAWAGPSGLVFNRSLDEGNTWLEEERFIHPFSGGWDYAIPGLGRCNGLPVTTCDLSQGPHRGRIYVNWTDQRNGNSDTDVWLIYSDDQGDTWSESIRVNDDAPGKHQFLTWMDIDVTTGYLYFIFYDRRNYSDRQTDVYLAISKDGGNTFENIKISDAPFVPNDGIFFGDYTNIVAHNGIVRPIWTRLHNGALSIWTDIRNHDELVNTVGPPPNETDFNMTSFPNPTESKSYVSFKLHESSTINLSVFTPDGIHVQTLIDDEIRGYGKYVETILLDGLNIQSGVYIVRLSVNDVVQTTKIIKVD